jgi:hypothetical protein
MTTPEEEVELQMRRHAAVRRQPAVRQAAARAVMAADESLGQDTPQWIRDLAEEQLGPLPTAPVPRPAPPDRTRPWSRWRSRRRTR